METTRADVPSMAAAEARHTEALHGALRLIRRRAHEFPRLASLEDGPILSIFTLLVCWKDTQPLLAPILPEVFLTIAIHSVEDGHIVVQVVEQTEAENGDLSISYTVEATEKGELTNDVMLNYMRAGATVH